MSKTPRVDALICQHGHSTTRTGDKAVIVSDTRFAEEVFSLAKQLETELAEARAEIEKLLKEETTDEERY